MTNPGSLSNLVPDDLGAVWAVIRELRQQVRELQTASFGNRMTVDGAPGITVKGGGGLTVQDGGGIAINDGGGLIVQGGGSIEVDDGGGFNVNDGGDVTLVGGDLIASGGVLRSSGFVHGASGWRLQPGGNAEFNDITLRGGIIGDDALTNPLRSNYYFDQASNYAIHTGVGGTATVRASFNITIPTGFTSVLIFASVQDYGFNDSGAPDYLHSCIRFGSSGTDWVQASSATVPDGSGGQSIVVTTDQYTGLSDGDVVPVQSRPFTDYQNWSSYAGNSTVLSALALFFR